jgi:hypothetical protein
VLVLSRIKNCVLPPIFQDSNSFCFCSLLFQTLEFLTTKLPTDGGNMNIEMHVYDKDTLKTDDFMGVAVHSLSALASTPGGGNQEKGSFEGWLPLYRSVTGKDIGSPKGGLGSKLVPSALKSSSSKNAAPANKTAAVSFKDESTTVSDKKPVAAKPAESKKAEDSGAPASTEAEEPAPEQPTLLIRHTRSDPLAESISNALHAYQSGTRFAYRVMGRWERPVVLAGLVGFALAHSAVAWYFDTPALVSVFSILAILTALWWLGQLVRLKPAFWEPILGDHPGVSPENRADDFDVAVDWLADCVRAAKSLTGYYKKFSSSRAGLFLLSVVFMGLAWVINAVPDIVLTTLLSVGAVVYPGIAFRLSEKDRAKRAASQKRAE